MTALLTDEAPMVVLDGEEGDEAEALIHFICECDPDIAICGEELTGPFWVNAPEEDECVVCVDLGDKPCPRCGAELKQ